MATKVNPVLKGDAKRRLAALEAIEGCNVLSWRHGGNTHVKFRVQLPNGEERIVVCPATGSDDRGLKNMTSMVRRWIRQLSVTDAPES